MGGKNSPSLDCKTVGVFLKISKEIGKTSETWLKNLTRAIRESPTRRACQSYFSVSPQSRSLFSASLQTFYLTARAYLRVY